jgi:hypothetical protein
MKSRFYTPREALIPKGALKVSDRRSDAVAYVYTNASGKPCARVFYGQQAKPVAAHYYRNEADREASIRRYFEARQQHDAAKAEQAAQRKVATATKVFEVGTTYYDRAMSDWDTIYAFKIVGRTAKQLTIEERGEKTYKRGIYVYDGVECCKPHGTYSMCSVIRADRTTP